MRVICGIQNLVPTDKTMEQMGLSMQARQKNPIQMWQQADTLLMTAGADTPAQPMELDFEGNHFVMVFCGRLRDAECLRQQLLHLNHRLLGTSHAELVLHSYAQWGSDCVSHLSGGFAFAVWNQKEQQLFLARDQMGTQTLFYTVYQGALLFASELKTILSFPGFPAAIDRTGAAELLLIGPGRTPGCGVFRGIHELEPGCCAQWKSGQLQTKRYWKLTDGPHTMDFEQTAEQIRILVTDAILQQMEPEHMGAFLSGGLDSSIVCSVCAEALAKQGRKLDSFSVDYRNNDRYFTPGKFQPTSDSDFMGILEQALHTNAHRIILTSQQLEQGIEDAVLARDLPGMADVDISLLRFSREIRKYVSVILSGECADELFGGYPWYRDPEVRNREGFPWAQSTENRLGLLQPELAAKLDGHEYIRSRYEQTVAESDILPDTPELERRMKQMMNLNVHWFMQTLLERNRAMSGFHDLEIRSPFCDHHLAQLLYRIPWEMKDYRGYEKGLLRHAMADLLPREILLRKKSPYPKTHDPEFLHLMQCRLERLIEDSSAPIWSLISPKAARELEHQQLDWPFYGQLMRTPQTICYLLQMDFWLRHYHVDLQL